MPEPELLRRGKAFHRLVQSDWLNAAKGPVSVEHRLSLLPRPGTARIERHGRMDIFVGKESGYVTVVEVKATQWDDIPPRNRRRNLASHRRQIWRYIEKHLDGDGHDVCAGIIYPCAPKEDGVRPQIEQYLNDYGIQAVWYYGEGETPSKH